MHLAVDILGLPHAMFVTTANVTARAGALSMIRYAAPNLSKCLKVLVDGGYSGENFANSMKNLIGAEVEVIKRNELHKLIVLPKRWIVERSFGCLKIIACYGKTANERCNGVFLTGWERLVLYASIMMSNGVDFVKLVDGVGVEISSSGSVVIQAKQELLLTGGERVQAAGNEVRIGGGISCVTLTDTEVEIKGTNVKVQ